MDHLPELLSGSDHLRLVTLGENARKRVAQLGFTPDAALNHPQWERRFRAAGLADYAEQLRKAIRHDP